MRKWQEDPQRRTRERRPLAAARERYSSTSCFGATSPFLAPVPTCAGAEHIAGSPVSRAETPCATVPDRSAGPTSYYAREVCRAAFTLPGALRITAWRTCPSVTSLLDYFPLPERKPAS